MYSPSHSVQPTFVVQVCFFYKNIDKIKKRRKLMVDHFNNHSNINNPSVTSKNTMITMKETDFMTMFERG